MTTATNVLAELEQRNLNIKQEAADRYRLNSPLRPNSDSHGFVLTTSPDGESGVYYDHVNEATGSLYDLAKHLNVTPTPYQNGHLNTLPDSTTSKRQYAGLTDYAQAHGVCADVFTSAGWSETTYQGRPALSFRTETGIRYRFLDGEKPPYKHKMGYRITWYGLNRAVNIAKESGQPLVICNGEASTVVGQHFGLAATALTSGEKGKLTTVLFQRLQEAYQGRILIAFDCDKKGRSAAPKLARQLRQAGYNVEAVDLGGQNGFDLADFCKLHQANSKEKLQNCSIVAESNLVADSDYLVTESPDDEGNAQCLSRLYTGQFHYCEEIGWLSYDGRYWHREKADARLERAIVDTLKKRRTAAVAHDKEKIITAAKPNAGNVRNCKTLFRSLVTVSISEFDNNPDLLNCANGVLNLRTGQLATHSPHYKFTYCLNIDYDPQADDSEWAEWLYNALRPEGETDDGCYLNLAVWVQMAVGYSLTGHTYEQCLFFLQGPTRGGKGIFQQTLLKLLGNPLSSAVDFDTFTAKRSGDNQNFDLAPLKACRLITASESNRSNLLNAKQVKAITGNDPIYCAFKRKDFFNYTPQFKIWLASNFKVMADANDDALWGRLRIITFPNSYLGREDFGLANRLHSNMAGILKWAVDGAKEWYRVHDANTGLGHPQIIDQTTQIHRDENDTVKQFIADCCIMGNEQYTVGTQFTKAYKQWCEENDFIPLGGRRLGDAMRKKGFTYGQKWASEIQKNTKCWFGIGLLT